MMLAIVEMATLAQLLVNLLKLKKQDKETSLKAKNYLDQFLKNGDVND
jgi:hypothetical protein